MTTTPESLPIAVVLDADDAEAFLSAQPACRSILALTPAARVVLKQAPSPVPVPVLDTVAFYSSIGHRRTVLHLRRAIAELNTALKQEPQLGPAAQEALIIILFYLTATSSRLTQTLKAAGPWLVWHDGTWQSCDQRERAHALLLRKVVALRLDHALWDRNGMPPLSFLARWASLLIARTYHRRQPVVLGYSRRQLDLLGAEITAENPARPVLSVHCTSGSWRDYLSIARSLLRALRGSPQGRLHAMPLNSAQTAPSVQRALDNVSDPAARAGLAAAPELPLGAAILTSGLARHLTTLFAAAAPAALVTDSLGWGPGAAAGEAAEANAVPVMFLSHSSHAIQTEATARELVNLWTRYGRIHSRFATVLLPKTPHAARIAEAAKLPGWTVPQDPYVWLPREAEKKPAQDGTFNILHACNFANWGEHVPWALLTSDEFVKGIEILAAVAGEMAGTHLVVRPKDKAECNAGTLEALIPARANVEFRNSGSFAKDLAEADLVVSFSSSTIEEALHQRTPVLLWGGGPDYRHLPAREQPPQPDDRAAVYVATSRRSLEAMLPAIATAHRGHPLQDQELGQHVWPSGTPDWKEFARRLARGEAANTADQDYAARTVADPLPKPKTRVITQ